MTVKSGTTGRHDVRARRTEYRWRFGLSGDAVRPLFAPPAPVGPAGGPPVPVRRRMGGEMAPEALALYEPGLSGGRRLLARLATSGTVHTPWRPRPVSTKGLVSVSAGAVVGMMLGQLFDAVTFVAPLYGLVLGATGGAAGWTAVRRRRAVVISVDEWRPQLESIGRILRNADAIGQPFVSPPALRLSLHAALWHAVQAVDEPGDATVLAAFDEQLAALRRATEATLAEIESPSIEARTADVSERLADAVHDLELSVPAGEQHRSVGDAPSSLGEIS